MRMSIRGIAAAGAVSLLAAMGPAAVASAASADRPSGSPGAALGGPPNEVKGFVHLRDFPSGQMVKGGMGTFVERCSRGNNGRPFEFKGEARLDATVTHGGDIFGLFCGSVGPDSVWRLTIVSPDGVRGMVEFFLGYTATKERGVGDYMECRGESGDIRCINDRTFGSDLQIVVEPKR